MIATSTKIRKTEWTGLELPQVKALFRRLGVAAWDIRTTINLVVNDDNAHMSTNTQRPEDGSRAFYLRLTNQGCGEFDVELIWWDSERNNELHTLPEVTPCPADTGVQHGPQFVADPANPTDAELTAAIERGIARGDFITWEQFKTQLDAGERDLSEVTLFDGYATAPGVEVTPVENTEFAPVVANLGLRDTERVVEIVSAEGTAWETSGTADEADLWFGNAYETDRQAIRLAVRQEAAQGRALRISFPSVMTFILGYDFDRKRYTLHVPE